MIYQTPHIQTPFFVGLKLSVSFASFLTRTSLLAQWAEMDAVPQSSPCVRLLYSLSCLGSTERCVYQTTQIDMFVESTANGLNSSGRICVVQSTSSTRSPSGRGVPAAGYRGRCNRRGCGVDRTRILVARAGARRGVLWHPSRCHSSAGARGVRAPRRHQGCRREGVHELQTSILAILIVFWSYVLPIYTT